MQNRSTNLHFILFYLICLILLLSQSSLAATAIKAPSWEGSEWINLETGAETLDVKDLKGRVVYLSFFQKW